MSPYAHKHAGLGASTQPYKCLIIVLGMGCLPIHTHIINMQVHKWSLDEDTTLCTQSDAQVHSWPWGGQDALSKHSNIKIHIWPWGRHKTLHTH